LFHGTKHFGYESCTAQVCGGVPDTVRQPLQISEGSYLIGEKSAYYQ